MNTWGNKLKITIFGESHGEVIGVVIDGLVAGTKLNFKDVNFMLSRRRAGKDKYTTSRVEEDKFEILSGLRENIITGAPLTVIFKNNNTLSRDYGNLENLLRPSHADYPAKIKFKGFNDFKGGGQFSGRLTLALTFVGGIAKSLLKERNIHIFSHIKKISNINDMDFLTYFSGNNDSNLEKLLKLEEKTLPFIKKNLENEANKFLEKIKNMGDSVGGIIECAAINLPVGLGSPFFESLESKISQLAFSVPAVKGIEFGIGFDFANKLGSTANDCYYLDNEEIKTKTNNNGGILGGLSTGMPLIFSVVIKPTPSISLEQKTVNIKNMKEEILKINGRHDSCIVPRVIPVIESILAITILEEILSS